MTILHTYGKLKGYSTSQLFYAYLGSSMPSRFPRQAISFKSIRVATYSRKGICFILSKEHRLIV